MSLREHEALPEAQLIRSLNHEILTFVRFVNKTERTVYLFWAGYDGKIVNYGRLGPGRVLEMDTYETHPWLVKDSVTSFSLLMNGKPVFYPREHVDEIPFENNHRDVVDIHIPVFTLLQRCAEVVYKEFGKERLQTFDIPRELKQTLTNLSGPSYDRSYRLVDDDESEGDSEEEN